MKRHVKAWLTQSRALMTQLSNWLPERVQADWAQHTAARWMAAGKQRGFAPLKVLSETRLADLQGVDAQKTQIERNTRQFLAGLPANHVLLWGARGTGKSSLVHALLHAYASDGLRLVEVDRTSLVDIALIADELDGQPYRFIVFCDDLSFERDDPGYKQLKSALEGSIFRSSDNVLVYATSNRRHLMPETHADNAGVRVADGELHHGEAIEEVISLSDRFGLWLSFYPFRQETYVELARYWVAYWARKHQLETVLWNDEARAAALRWALARGVRSGRTAQHFARDWVGAHLLDGSQ